MEGPARHVLPGHTPRRIYISGHYDSLNLGSSQQAYELATPKRLPKGTRGVAHYDNSPGNRYNPDPTKDVRWGDQTWEEMKFTAASSSSH